MPTSAHAIANVFIQIAQGEDKQLTNMQLQKLVFISQGYTLALLDRPLYYHDTHAWQWGPVIPKLYKSLQPYGKNFVTEALKADDILDPKNEEMEIVNAVWDGYGHFSGSQLSALTHKENTPWSIVWHRDKFGIIPKQLIADHYKQMVGAS